MKAGEIYKVEIGFLGEKHCLYCPLRDKEDDTCNLQQFNDENSHFASWEDQMIGCPLRFDREVTC